MSKRHHRDNHPKHSRQRREHDYTRRSLLRDVVHPWIFDDLFRHYEPIPFMAPVSEDPDKSYRHLMEKGERMLRERGINPARRRVPPLSTEDLSRYQHATYDMLKDEIVCRERADRREVLFAKRKAGRGKRVSAFRRFTDNSKIDCRGR